MARRIERYVDRKAADEATGSKRRLPLGRGTALALGFMAAAGLYGAHHSGQFGVAASKTAAEFGLGLGDLSITGLTETTPQAVYAAVGLDERPSVVGLDLTAARKRVLDLPWVSKATLRTVYPGKLSVEIEEREAFAVWQTGQVLTVVERTGRPITKFGIEDLLTDRFSTLPNVVGEGAAEHAAELLPLAAKHAGLTDRISAYVRVADRRWDIVFDNGFRLKLPEYGIGNALARFASVAAEHELLERPILIADLRDPSRMTLRLRPDVAKDRAKEVAKHLKDMKAAEPKRRKRL